MTPENKTDRIRRLAGEGISHKEIAELVDTTIRSVSVTLCRLRNGRDRKCRKAMVVRMDPTVRDTLAREAERRMMSEQSLARIIIEAVVRDSLFGAIFDDEADA